MLTTFYEDVVMKAIALSMENNEITKILTLMSHGNLKLQKPSSVWCQHHAMRNTQQMKTID